MSFHKKFVRKFIPKEIYNPISDAAQDIRDFVDEDILDPAG